MRFSPAGLRSPGIRISLCTSKLDLIAARRRVSPRTLLVAIHLIGFMREAERWNMASPVKHAEAILQIQLCDVVPCTGLFTALCKSH